MRKLILSFLALLVICMLVVLIYNLQTPSGPLADWASKLRLKFVFAPAAGSGPSAQGTLRPIPILRPSPTLNLTPAPPTQTLPVTPLPSPTPTSLPPSVNLTGVVYKYEQWNNSATANLMMALTYWGWNGDQQLVANYLRPNARDLNVMPWEMAAYVQEKTDLNIITRVGGDHRILKSLVSSGYPVIVEKAVEDAMFGGWMSRYELVTGYDDEQAAYIVQDSSKGANRPDPYDALESGWRAFNYQYMVVYPAKREAQVTALLGPQADESANYQYAAQKALDETKTLTGRDQYFAWFNRGSNLVSLKDYASAATAFDAAFANYNSIPEAQRPWRMLWYQTGPYFAYFFTQRYKDVINLATTTLDSMPEPIHEESFYWRGRARAALGDNLEAIQDFRSSLSCHKGFKPSLEQLLQLGANP
jgi:tetratricopeptide (TPR) repeat protein